MLTRNKLSKTKKEERVPQPDVQMPSTSSEAGTSSVQKRKLPEKGPFGHGKKRLVEEDDKLQKLPEKGPFGHGKKRLVEEDDKLQKLPEKGPFGHGKKRLVEEDDKLQMISKVILTDCCARKQPDKAEDKVEENKQSDPLIFCPTLPPIPSTSSKKSPEPGTSSVKKRFCPTLPPIPSTSSKKSPEPGTSSVKKSITLKDDKRPTPKVLTNRERKRMAKAEEDEQCFKLLTSLIDDHSGSGLTGRSSINLLLPSNFKEEILDFTISCLSTNIRVSCAENEKFFGIFQDVAKFFRLNDGEFHLKFNGRPITAGDTPRTVGMPNRARIECIPLNRPHSSTNDAMNNP